MSAFDLTNPLKPTIVKDANAILDYLWDWSAWLTDISDTVSTFTVTPAVGITVGNSPAPTEAAGVVRAYLSGGVAGSTYQVTCRIVTVGLRTDERSIYLKIKEL